MRRMPWLVMFSVGMGLSVGAEGKNGTQAAAAAAATLEGTWRVEITLRNCDTGQNPWDPVSGARDVRAGWHADDLRRRVEPGGAGHRPWGRVAHARSDLRGPLRGIHVQRGLYAAARKDLAGDRPGPRRDDVEARVSSAVLNTAGQIVFAGCASSIGRRLD